MTEDFKPIKIPQKDGSDYAIPMPLGWMKRLRIKFSKDTDKILELYYVVYEAYPSFDFDYLFLAEALESLISYLDAGLTKNDWLRECREGSRDSSLN